MGLPDIGRMLLIAGGALVIIGAILLLAGKIPWFGRLPGDIVIRRDGFTLAFPIVTMLVVSLLATLIVNLILRFFR